MFGLLVGGAAAGGLAAAAGHLDEAAVQEALGGGKQLVELAAQMAFLGGREAGLTGLRGIGEGGA